jgi:hypothetical protein
MKPVKNMTLGELAAFVCTHLRKYDIRIVLSGGACVSIYSSNRYQSWDLDFIENLPSTRNKRQKAMAEIGFMKEQRYYKHPDTEFFVEFPPGPITVGDEPAKKPNEIIFETGSLTLLSPTDCIKDRLAGYYHWNDRQCLEQAILVAEDSPIDRAELKRWSENEGKSDEFRKVEPLLTRKCQKKSGE